MAKVNYRKCDICGVVLKKDVRVPGFINGYKIWNGLFNKLDICNSCIKKIKQLSIDVKAEEKYVDELFDKHETYENFDNESAYSQGVEDMLNILSNKRLKNIRIKK